MFEGIRNFIKGVISKMFPVKTISKVIGTAPTLSDTMINKIEEWSALYKGNAPWCDDYIKSLRLEQGICREFSNVVLNEMETSVSNSKLDKIYKAAIKNLNENLQSGLALGSFCIKPLGNDKVEYVTADRFIPIDFDSQDRLTDVAFIDVKKVGDTDYYFRFERHHLDTIKSVLTITNKAYHSKSMDSVGDEVPLNTVDEWSKLLPSASYSGVIKPDFGYYRNPIKNETDGSACGVSIFDNAIEHIKKADTQYARLEWEFESGERVVHVDIAALQPQAVVAQGKTTYAVPKLNERLYKGLNLQAGNNEELYKEYSPEFREQAIINGFNTLLRRIEFAVCLSYGDLSDVQDVEKTATEMKIAKKRKYNMVTAIQENLKECLEDLVYALAFYNAMTKSGYEFVCNFSDSILVDEEAERAQDRLDVGMGVMRHEEYRAKWYGETIEEALKNLPDQAEVIE